MEEGKEEKGDAEKLHVRLWELKKPAELQRQNKNIYTKGSMDKEREVIIKNEGS